MFQPTNVQTFNYVAIDKIPTHLFVDDCLDYERVFTYLKTATVNETIALHHYCLTTQSLMFAVPNLLSCMMHSGNTTVINSMLVCNGVNSNFFDPLLVLSYAAITGNEYIFDVFQRYDPTFRYSGIAPQMDKLLMSSMPKNFSGVYNLLMASVIGQNYAIYSKVINTLGVPNVTKLITQTLSVCKNSDIVYDMCIRLAFTQGWNINSSWVHDSNVLSAFSPHARDRIQGFRADDRLVQLMTDLLLNRPCMRSVLLLYMMNSDLCDNAVIEALVQGKIDPTALQAMPKIGEIIIGYYTARTGNDNTDTPMSSIEHDQS